MEVQKKCTVSVLFCATIFPFCSCWVVKLIFAFRQLAKRTIVLDSPGFDYTKENEHAMEKFLGNLKILQLFYSMSDLSLFMTPATHINMVSNQIATLELSVLYSLHGPEYH